MKMKKSFYVDDVKIIVMYSQGAFGFMKEVRELSESYLQDMLENIAYVLEGSPDFMLETHRGQVVLVVNKATKTTFVLRFENENTLLVLRVYAKELGDNSPFPMHGDPVLVHELNGDSIVPSYNHHTHKNDVMW